jgi:hypothetical protein
VYKTNPVELSLYVSEYNGNQICVSPTASHFVFGSGMDDQFTVYEITPNNSAADDENADENDEENEEGEFDRTGIDDNKYCKKVSDVDIIKANPSSTGKKPRKN